MANAKQEMVQKERGHIPRSMPTDKDKRRNPVPSKTETSHAGAKSKVLRISFLVPREAIPRLEWMMKVRRIPTKVDLLREALNFFEDHVVEQEATRAEKRRLAGAPPLTDPAD